MSPNLKTLKALIIEQVNGGFIVKIEGKQITREVSTMYGMQTIDMPQFHQFVFTEQVALHVFLAKLFVPEGEVSDAEARAISEEVEKQIAEMVSFPGFDGPIGMGKLKPN